MTMHVIGQHIEHPGAWKGCDLAGKEAVCFDLGPGHLAAIDSALRSVRARGLMPEQIEKDDFALDPLAGELARLREEVQNGCGLLVIRGLPVDRYPLPDIERIYWGVGTHIGVAVSQSVMGDRLGHVIDVTDQDPNARAYRNRSELTLHTDFADIVSFLCVRKAKTGGISWFASALAIHNEILATKPDYLEVLARGFPWHRYAEQGPDEAPITPYRVPVLSACEGYVSCRYVRDYITEGAAHGMGTRLSAFEVAALDYFEEIAHRQDMRIAFTLEPSDAVYTNNFTVLHARTAFENDPDPTQKRLLLRLWLTVPDGRPVVPEIQIYNSGRPGGVPPQEGRTPSYARRTLRSAIDRTDAG